MTEKITPVAGAVESNMFGERPRRDPVDELAAWALDRLQKNKPSAFELRLSINGTAGQLITRYDAKEVMERTSAWASDVYDAATVDRERMGTQTRYQVLCLGPSNRSCGRQPLDMPEDDSIESLAKAAAAGGPGSAENIALVQSSLRFGQTMGQFAANVMTLQMRAIVDERESFARREASYQAEIAKLRQELREVSTSSLDGLRSAWEAASAGEAKKLELAMSMETRSKLWEYLPFLLKQLGHRKEDAVVRRAIADVPADVFVAMTKALPDAAQPAAIEWYKSARKEAAEDAAAKQKQAQQQQGLSVNGPLDTEKTK